MPKFTPNEDSWPLIQSMGTWLLAVVLSLYEGLVRHGQDSALVTFCGGLLGLPVIQAYERRRQRERRGRDDDDRP